MRTITLANNKGGSAKTTTTVNLAAAFAERGLRVLAIDLDPQGSMTDWLGGRELPVGLVEFESAGIRIGQIVLPSTAPGVDLIPVSPGLLQSGGRSANEIGMCLVRAIARLPDYWDVVLVDTPPAVGYLSLAPLVASDHVIIPVEARALALSGVASVIASIERARRQVNTRLGLLGIVACRINATIHARWIVEGLRDQFGPAVLASAVRDAIRVAEGPALRLPVTEYAPTSQAANDFRAVAGELLDRLAALERYRRPEGVG